LEKKKLPKAYLIIGVPWVILESAEINFII